MGMTGHACTCAHVVQILCPSSECWCWRDRSYPWTLQSRSHALVLLFAFILRFQGDLLTAPNRCLYINPKTQGFRCFICKNNIDTRGFSVLMNSFGCQDDSFALCPLLLIYLRVQGDATPMARHTFHSHQPNPHDLLSLITT